MQIPHFDPTNRTFRASPYRCSRSCLSSGSASSGSSASVFTLTMWSIAPWFSCNLLYSTLAQLCALEQCWPRLIKVPVFGFGKQLRQLLKLEAATSEAQQSLQKKMNKIKVSKHTKKIDDAMFCSLHSSGFILTTESATLAREYVNVYIIRWISNRLFNVWYHWYLYFSWQNQVPWKAVAESEKLFVANHHTCCKGRSELWGGDSKFTCSSRASQWDLAGASSTYRQSCVARRARADKHPRDLSSTETSVPTVSFDYFFTKQVKIVKTPFLGRVPMSSKMHQNATWPGHQGDSWFSVKRWATIMSCWGVTMNRRCFSCNLL